MPVIPFSNFCFKVEKVDRETRARAASYLTPHGKIETPAFIPVATKGTVKSLTPEMVSSLGAVAVLANTFHLYLEPGSKLVARAGGVGKFMNWSGPTLTDSGGFQVFSLGAAFGKNLSKVGNFAEPDNFNQGLVTPLAKIDDDGVTFRSPLDGSEHRFTAEISIAIQRQLGADIIFAFDECLPVTASLKYQHEALDRTHAWAERSLAEHRRLAFGAYPQALYGVVQGGNSLKLRRESASIIAKLDFDGFGIGGAFDQKDIEAGVSVVTDLLPPDRPRHLLGIGFIQDIFAGVAEGMDTFDCVIPTRLARHGALETNSGRINILRAEFREDFSPIDPECGCYTCLNYSKNYLAHLFRAKEMLAATLASIHNLYFFVQTVKGMREAIMRGEFSAFRKNFLDRYLFEKK